MGRQRIAAKFKDHEGQFQSSYVVREVADTVGTSDHLLVPGGAEIGDSFDLTYAGAMNRLKVVNCGNTAVSSGALVHWCDLESGEVFDGRTTPFETVLAKCRQPYPILDLSEMSESQMVAQFLASRPERLKEIGTSGSIGPKPGSRPRGRPRKSAIPK